MPKNYRVRASTRASSQILTERESAALEKYLSGHYTWPVNFSRRIVISRSSSDLQNSVTLKSGDVFTLQGKTLYHTPKLARAKPLKAVGNGLFVIQDRNDGDNIHLELVRITDFATRVAAV